MRAMLIAVGVVALFVGCSQPLSPTSTTSVPVASAFTPSAEVATTGIGLDVPSGRTAAAAKEVPFKGSLSGVVTVTFDPPPSPLASVLIEGSGHATHLGRFVVSMPHRVSFATATGTGTIQFTAANGDLLTADFTGQADTSTSVFSIVETATITGGTGRFSDATGLFTIKRLFDTVTGLTSGSFEGTISSRSVGNP